MNEKWQYKVESIKLNAFSGAIKQDEIIQERLNRLGLDGWRLINVTQVSGGYPRLYLRK